jgi:hypothetical protein
VILASGGNVRVVVGVQIIIHAMCQRDPSLPPPGGCRPPIIYLSHIVFAVFAFREVGIPLFPPSWFPGITPCSPALEGPSRVCLANETLSQAHESSLQALSDPDSVSYPPYQSTHSPHPSGNMYPSALCYIAFRTDHGAPEFFWWLQVAILANPFSPTLSPPAHIQHPPHSLLSFPNANPPQSLPLLRPLRSYLSPLPLLLFLSIPAHRLTMQF